MTRLGGEDREVGLVGDQGTGAEVGADADTLEDGGERGERGGVGVWEPIRRIRRVSTRSPRREMWQARISRPGIRSRRVASSASLQAASGQPSSPSRRANDSKMNIPLTNNCKA